MKTLTSGLAVLTLYFSTQAAFPYTLTFPPGITMAANHFNCDRLLLFAYPLHPAGKPEKLRDAHLPKIAAPVLCFNGTRDTLCDRALMEAALKNVRAPWEMHWIEGADHSFHVLKSSGRTDAEVLQEVGDATERWLTY